MLIQTLLMGILALTTPTLSLPHAEPEPQRAELQMLESGPCEFKQRADISPTKELYKHQQVTKSQGCSTNPSCEAGETTSYTFGYEVGGGVNSAFTSAGIAVSESWTNEENHVCGGEKGDYICVWIKVKYLEYQAKATGYCKPDLAGTTRTFRAPITGQGQDQEYYCVSGRQYCRQDGDFYWEE